MSRFFPQQLKDGCGGGIVVWHISLTISGVKQKLHIGTSGWSYKHWKGDFYPPAVAVSRWLPYYAEQFGTTEINSSFYRLPSPATLEKWVEQVPEGFLFCPKMSRYLTHMKKLRGPEEPLDRFFTLFAPIYKSLGPVLLQLPPQLKFHREIVQHFYELLRKNYRDHDFVVEVRHESWLEELSLRLMEKYHVGLVISESGGEFPYSEIITSKTVYLRFHGPAALYASSYSDAQLKKFAGKMKGWLKEGHEVWAFFNNDIHGYAPKDAKRLEKRMGTGEQVNR